MPYEFGDYPVPSTLAPGAANINTFLRGDGVWGTAASLAANTFTGLQTFNAGVNGGLDAVAGNALKGITKALFPRNGDFTSLMQDHLDELALATYNTAWTISANANGTAITGSSLATLFTDDSGIYVGSGNIYPIVIDFNFNASPVNVANNEFFRVGLTFRSTVPVTSVLIEAWTGTAYATVVNATGLSAADYPGGFWLSPPFIGNVTTNNMDRLRITLGGTNPTPPTLFLQRVMLYHASAIWNPWHVHRLGSTMYGNLNMTNGATVTVAGNAVWHPGNLTPGVTTPVRTVTANYTVLLTDGTIFVDATAGPVTITLPTAASAIVGTQGQRVRVKKNDASPNAVTIVATGGQIDGVPNAVISTPYNAFEFSPIPGTANWGGF